MEQVETLGKEVGVSKACEVLEIPRSRVYRYREAGDERTLSEPKLHPRALSQEEKAQVRKTLNSERFQDQAPREIYAKLLDDGEYLCTLGGMPPLAHDVSHPG